MVIVEYVNPWQTTFLVPHKDYLGEINIMIYIDIKFTVINVTWKMYANQE